VGNGDAFNLQTIANTTVFDSLENWQRYGNNPFAKYTYTLNGNTVSFTNLSKRFQNLTWDFGDGQTSAQASPTHTYTQAGTMKACLTITNNCGTTTSVCDTFSLNTSGINDLAVGNHQVFTYYNNTVTLQPSVTATAFELYNLNGQLLKQFELSPNYFQMKLQDFPAGIYLLTGRNTAGSYKEKIQIQ
jgi:PKD repeat protein